MMPSTGADKNERGNDGSDRRQRKVHLQSARGLGSSPRKYRGESVRRFRRLTGQGLLLQPKRRASGYRLRSRRQFPVVLGGGMVPFPDAIPNREDRFGRPHD